MPYIFKRPLVPEGHHLDNDQKISWNLLAGSVLCTSFCVQNAFVFVRYSLSLCHETLEGASAVDCCR